jgi:hypothetical protein
VERIAKRLHRVVLEPLGFERRGNTCVRRDSLVRTVRFYGLRATHPQVQVLLMVAIPDLPDPVVAYRRDALWAPLEPETGPNHYLRPLSTEPPPAELASDLAGPGTEFLLRAENLRGFVAWAEQIYKGDRHPNWWGRFRPVMPQGTAALQAAATAAAMAGDDLECVRLGTRVMTLEPQKRERDDFMTELARVAPELALRVGASTVRGS